MRVDFSNWSDFPCTSRLEKHNRHMKVYRALCRADHVEMRVLSVIKVKSAWELASQLMDMTEHDRIPPKAVLSSSHKMAAPN